MKAARKTTFPSVVAIVLLCALFLAAHAQASFGFRPAAAGFDVSLLEDDGLAAQRGGSHPYSLSLAVGFALAGEASSPPGGPFTDDDVRNLDLDLPRGLFENPNAVTRCSSVEFQSPRLSPFQTSLSGESCPLASQVGVATVSTSFAGGSTRTFGVFNLEPPPGASSQLGFSPFGMPIVLTRRIQGAEGEYSLSLQARDIPQRLSLQGFEMTLWGNPWLVDHDAERGNCLNEVDPGEGFGTPATLEPEPQPDPDNPIPFVPGTCSVGDPRQLPPTAYLTLPTSCEGGAMKFSASAASWQGSVPITRSLLRPLGQCSGLAFEPKPAAQLINPRASSPSGYAFDIAVDQRGLLTNFTPTGRLLPDVRAPSPLRKAVVRLPDGVTINPSVGAGLGVCRLGQYAAETPTSPPGAGCPNESKIGDFSVESPIVAGRLQGAIFLAAPFDNPFGSLIAIYLVAKNSERGALVKVAGELEANPATGSLLATFDRLPQLPYSQLSIRFREGQRSPLATPGRCGAFSTEVDLTPWRDPNLLRHASLPLTIAAGTGGGPCPAGLAPFAPTAKGGTLNSRAGAYSPFYLQLTRKDTEQEIVSYSATFPPGLLGRVAGIPFCPEAAIAAAAKRSGLDELRSPSCPVASQIGRTLAGYGLGSVLSYAPGNLYLAGPYRGSEFSVVAIDAALVGPFDLGVVIVRSAIRVDRHTGQVSIDATGTDPIPHIIGGIPVHLRDVRAYIDRPRMTLNPTSCAPFALGSALNGAGVRFADASDDSLATASAPFQAFDCGSLGFRPRISMKLVGKTKRGASPSLRAVVRPRAGDANIGRAQVTLPPSLFLAQRNIETICTRVQFARDACPKGSVYGRARAFTPLLAEPMEGPVYLRSSENPLPDVVFVLRSRGFRVDLVGRVDSLKGGIRGTFDVIPDAPVSKFVLRMRGGKRGILVNAAEDVCRAPALGRARLIGHNDKGWIFRPKLSATCGKEGS